MYNFKYVLTYSTGDKSNEMTYTNTSEFKTEKAARKALKHEITKCVLYGFDVEYWMIMDKRKGIIEKST